MSVIAIFLSFFLSYLPYKLKKEQPEVVEQLFTWINQKSYRKLAPLLVWQQELMMCNKNQ
jgi:hypothetical protein